ncbi:hypothetical protein PDE_09103 [Penicillium oxalicum 114-2]|uniref:Azaphilone pigments biosynthesis cluster protein L N-terminal domain-containing protein n=1 Tax=Penicillium oxalicum (strain 114-2 / CGMCC 5302) TaxID=933388 RepID=S7ZZ81_PENO1|nr:hypothetical protein PDE_09103 [Penicillium oxalicum 114-2]
MRYMGQDIDGFRRMMAGYKSTIIIALTDANLLESYKEMIEITTGDLEAYLETIDEKLEKIIAYNANDLSADAGELQIMEEERLSTQKCLEICNSPYDAVKHNASSSVSETVTNEGLQECKNSLSNTAAKLESHLKALMDRIVTKSRTAMTSQEDIVDMIRLQEEWETTR